MSAPSAELIIDALSGQLATVTSDLRTLRADMRRRGWCCADCDLLGDADHQRVLCGPCLAKRMERRP